MIALVTLVAALIIAAREVMHRRELGRLERELTAASARIHAGAERAEVDELVSGLARDLKSPLQGVLGNTELMLAVGEGTTAQPEELRHIRDDAARAAAIVRNLLAVTETTALVRRWQDLNDIVNHALAGISAELLARRVTVMCGPQERLPLVYVDGRQIEKVVATLVGRSGIAGQNTPASKRKSSTVTVKAVRASVPDDRLIITIEDDAPLRPGEEQILGSIGLAASQQIVRAHGGSLQIGGRSDGPGMRAVIEFPVAADALATTSQESSPTWTTSSTSSTSTATGISTS